MEAQRKGADKVDPGRMTKAPLVSMTRIRDPELFAEIAEVGKVLNRALDMHNQQLYL